MADLSYDIDPGGTGDYLSLTAWEAAQEQNLISGGNTMTAHCTSSDGSDDTAQCIISGWTADFTNYIKVIGDDFPSNAQWDDTKYQLNVTNNTTGALYIYEDGVILENLQIKGTITTDGVGIYVRADCRIDSCYVKGVCSGTGSGIGIDSVTTGADLTMWNTIMDGWVSGGDSGFRAVELTHNSTWNFYNCTFYGNYRGIYSTSGTINFYNNCVGNSADDYNVGGTFNADYNCSDDGGDGANSTSPLGGSWDNEFTTPGTDYSLESGGNCVGGGTDDPGSGQYSDDIIGTARSSTWDIGAFEYSGGAPPAGLGMPIAVHHNKTMRVA